jgi:hypothetical protein
MICVSAISYGPLAALKAAAVRKRSVNVFEIVK